MQGDRPCPRCGQLIPVGHDQCPHCAKPQGWWRAERESLLLLSILSLVILFAVTGIAANFYHAGRESLAEDWYARGVRDLKDKNAGTALEDFRTALAYSPDNSNETPVYRLHLAQALVAMGKVEEARAHLLTLWRDEPGNSTVNLELARLAAQRGDAVDALRYYHNAVYGVWPADPGAHRVQTRMELSAYLLAQHKSADAQSELIALEAELPRDAALLTQVAGMLRKAGDRNRALGAYRQALEIDRHQHEALEGAGEMAFELGDYQGAVDYLQRAARAGTVSEAARDKLSTARMVLILDPTLPRLSRAEADQRMVRDFNFAVKRLSDCQNSLASVSSPGRTTDDLTTLSSLAEDLKASASTSALRQNPDLRVNLMDFVFSAEETTAKACGNPSGADWALLLISRKQGTPER